MPLQELLLLVIKLLSLSNDVFLLVGETLVDLSLFSLFLEEANSLERTLALHNEGSHSGQVLVADLRLGVLAHALVDTIE